MTEGKGRVLIAEDNEDIRDIVEAIFMARGDHVTLARDGEEAWKLYQEQKGELSVLLTDFGMPKMTGDELIRRVKQDNPNFPIVLYTAGEENIKRAKEAGADYVLEKPFENKVLAETVRKAIDDKKQE